MTRPQPRWVTNPQTEAEWDMHTIKMHGQEFFHCWWLATHYPAARKYRRPSK